MCPSNYNPGRKFIFVQDITVSEIERDIGRKSSIFHTPFYSTPPLGEFPSEYRHPVWYGKTRMAQRSNFEDIFIRFRAARERDGRTPGDGIYRAYAYGSRGKKTVAQLNADVC